MNNPSTIKPKALIIGLPLAVAAVLATCVPLFFQHVTVTSSAQLERMRFGVPFRWVVQDQSWRSQPFPYELGVDSPRQSPTFMVFPAFVADVLILYVAVAAVVFVGWLAYRSARTLAP